MFTWPTACALPPVIDPTGAITGAAHVYVVPAGTMPFTPLAGADVNALALQIVDVILFIDATGLTVTVTVKFAPVQPPDNGVTV
jgi:hypothetical protein